MTYNEAINNPGYFALLVPSQNVGKFDVASMMPFIEFEKLSLTNITSVACELLVRAGFQVNNRVSEEATQLVQRGSARVSWQFPNVHTDCYFVSLMDDSCLVNAWGVKCGINVNQRLVRNSDLQLETSARKSLKDVVNSLNSACFTQNFTTNCCGVKFFNNSFQNISLSGDGITLVGFKAPKGHTASGRGDFSESIFKSTTTHRVFKDGKYLRKFKKGSTLTQTSGGRVHTLVAETCHKRYFVGSRHYYFVHLNNLKVSN